ncbi:hypothetical protein LCGC14_2582260 [marine sediment metagenome]|uniref:Uncharacterized protein n=2 Tax=root TaxID=1 RepID=A0A831QNT5_9FLAO|nr:hypothetical protein [Pricia antarctica]
MKKLVPFFVSVLLLIVISATAQDSEKEQTQMQEVMQAHDQVMDRMPELAKLIGNLEVKGKKSDEKQKYDNAIKDLKAANKSMMDWMISFGKRFEADEMYKGKALSEQKKVWVLEEQMNIAVLREEINLSIQQGKKLLKD